MEYATRKRLSSVAEPTSFVQVQIKSSSDANRFVRQFFHDDISMYESFFIVMLNTANRTEAYAKISQGGISATVVDKRIVAKLAVDHLCHGVILCHNHPSGNTQPSQADVNLTKELAQALDLFNIKILDHIIITTDSYLSFADDSSFDKFLRP
jgi:DNA repair protein RadC